jgi:hypothetical protein
VHHYVVIHEKQIGRRRPGGCQIVHARKVEGATVGDPGSSEALDAAPHIFAGARLQVVHYQDLGWDCAGGLYGFEAFFYLTRLAGTDD